MGLKTLRILKNREYQIGFHQLSKDISCHIAFPPHDIALSEPAGLPSGVLASVEEDLLPRSYTAGPVYMLRVQNCVVDRQTGYCMTSDGRVVAETLPTKAHESSAERAFAAKQAKPERRAAIARAVLLTSARHANYCRWWFDCISRAFVAEAYQRLVPEFAKAPVITPFDTSRFQSESLELLSLQPVPGSERFLEVEDLLIPCGLTYRNGQRVSGLVPSYMEFLKARLPAAAPKGLPGDGSRLYISRAKAAIRRLRNEGELLDALSPFGFTVVDPGNFSLKEQVALFSRARIVVAPHGAALTNLLFGSPGLRLVEIFSRDGLHTSSFRHLCQHLGGAYSVVLGQSGQEPPLPEIRKPRDEDIVLPREAINALTGSMPRLLEAA